MIVDPIQTEAEAYESVSVVYAAARKCRELHERAGLPLPPRIQRLLDPAPPTASVHSDGSHSARIPAPEHASVPREATADWISVPIEEGTATTVALAVLRGANGDPVRARDVSDRVIELLPQTTPGTIANSGTRLSNDGTIARTDEGWMLLKMEKAPILHDGMLWGPDSVFAREELAAYRRMAILHILKHYPKGLQVVQIVEQLNACEWVRATANKDMLKLDMQALMDAKKVRRVGNTRKWQLAPAERPE
jgi:hypothetical protein